MQVQFTIPGNLPGKGRVRHHGKKHWVDAKTKAGESIVLFFAAAAMGRRELLCGPIEVRVAMYMHCPAWWSKKRKAEAVYVTGKPDVDNIQKLLFDSMNGICYTDDSQIAVVEFVRRYAQGAERVEVIVEELSGSEKIA